MRSTPNLLMTHGVGAAHLKRQAFTKTQASWPYVSSSFDKSPMSLKAWQTGGPTTATCSLKRVDQSVFLRVDQNTMIWTTPCSTGGLRALDPGSATARRVDQPAATPAKTIGTAQPDAQEQVLHTLGTLAASDPTQDKTVSTAAC